MNGTGVISRPGISSYSSGTVYNYYRDYDPATGRYLQPDPIGLAGGPNPYTYAGNNPLRFIDPLGLSKCAPDDEECIERCLREYYGDSYDKAKDLSPFGAAGLIADEYAEYVQEAGRGQANRDMNSGSYKKGQRIARSVTQLRAVSAVSGVIGAGAGGYVFGAYTTCLVRCELDDE